MSDDLDLRAMHRRHEPDPRFVAALGDRLEAIMANSASADVSTDEGSALMVELEPGDTQRPPPRRHIRRVFGAAAVLAAASVAVFAMVITQDRASRDDVTVSQGGPQPNGWVAFDRGGDIYLVRPGQDARRLEVAGSDTSDDECPTWSPDATRLSFGRLTGSSDTASSDAELVIVPVGRDGATGAPNVIALDGFHALPGFDPHPCATWSPDGRWVALGGTGEVWVVDTQTSSIRRLPDLRPIDLEWRPGTDQLAIAGDMGRNRAADWLGTPITVYSVSTDELHQLGPVHAGTLTWSPDGSTLAYEGEGGLWLVDAAGTNERLLVADPGFSNHGIGPVWSPTGDRIAYQRLIIGAGERHEVVLVSVADGSQTVIDPPETDGPDGPVRWYPWTVTWSPDGTTLLYNAWTSCFGMAGAACSEHDGLVAVPPDTPSDATVLTDANAGGDGKTHQWIWIQMWGRQPE